MGMNKVALTLLEFMTYMVMAGFMKQIGVLISPIRDYLGIRIKA